jgi:hypothetical protein
MYSKWFGDSRNFSELTKALPDHQLGTSTVIEVDGLFSAENPILKNLPRIY